MAIGIFQAASQRWIGHMFKLALAGGALIVCWQVAGGHLIALDRTTLWDHIRATPWHLVALACLCTAASYAAIAGYDLIAYRAVGRTAAAGRALRSGAAATAMGQLLGFGLVIGAFTRWRLMRDQGIGHGTAAMVSVLVAFGFLLGMAAVGAVLAVVVPGPLSHLTGASPDQVRIAGLVLLLLFAGLFMAGTRRLGLTIRGRAVIAPRPRVMAGQIALAAADLAFAGTALWLVVPAGVPWPDMVVAYLSALSLSLVANTPGGVGPLDGALLFALPHVETEALLAGLIVFRMIYYVAPGLIGILAIANAETGHRLTGGLAVWLRNRRAPLPTPSPAGQADLAAALAISTRAEGELVHLGDKTLLPSADGRAFLMYRRHGSALIAIGDPVGDPASARMLCGRFLHLARARDLSPVFYKIGDEFAGHVRAAGLVTDRAGAEAVIDLASFTLASAKRREIRRKVRQAARAGVTITFHPPGTAPLAALLALGADWQAARGKAEAGFSMGRCAPDYLRRFPIYVAVQDGVPVGFVSIWRSGDGQEWALDLMRQARRAPPGVMQALIVAACDGARAAGAARFNLCLAPLSRLEDPRGTTERIAHWVFSHADRFHHLQGLYRFKSAFRPRWQSRHIGRRPGLRGMLALWQVYRLIHAGAPLPGIHGAKKIPAPDTSAATRAANAPRAPDQSRDAA